MKQDSVVKVFQLTSALSAIVALVILGMQILSTDEPFNRLEGASEDMLRQLEDFQKQLDEFHELARRFDEVTAAIEEGAESTVAIANLRARQSEILGRLSSLEETLDLAPREVINLVLVEQKLTALTERFDSSTRQTLREVERAYNTVLALVGALVVSVLLLLLSSILPRRQDP